jgi:uncharacterized membrane protein
MTSDKIRSIVSKISAVFLFFAASLFGQTSSVISFDAPGALNDRGGATNPCCINNQGVIAGNYQDVLEKPHGFVRDANGVITEFTPLRFVGLGVSALNNRGQIVGSGVSAQNLVLSFLRTETGQITYFSFPGSVETHATAINDNGQIAGYYLADGGTHGFIRDADGTYTSFDDPNREPGGIFVWGINNNGEVAGYDQSSTGNYGFIRDAFGNFTEFSIVPGGPGAILFGGLNIRGEIVGAYLPRDRQEHAFLRDASGNIIDLFGDDNVIQVSAVDINNNSLIVGQQTDFRGIPLGFTRDSSGTITSFAVPSAKFGTFPAAINNSGRITGQYWDANRLVHAFVR